MISEVAVQFINGFIYKNENYKLRLTMHQIIELLK